MNGEINIPNLLRYVGITGYMPQLGEAINRMLRADDALSYKAAAKDAGTALFFPGSFFADLPKFMPLLLKGFDGKEDLLLDSATVSFSTSKNIVTTKLQGRNGTVKEYIADGDYTINVKGILAYNGVRWPREDAMKLREFLEAKTSLEIAHELLNAFGIYEIVITDYNFPESPYINLIPFTFSALSEQKIELKIME
ncbi:MAG: hypothetical protein HPY80_00235 [Bacteroidales bacterium]|nr:hypothetical protein [Bacteroidales bacterium]